MATTGVWQHSRRDALLVSAALAQGVLMLAAPPMPVVALNLWWGANTVSHNFIHLPFFRSRWANAGFSSLLTLVLGVPQSLWRARHLDHHGDTARPGRPTAPLAWTRAMYVEGTLLCGLWVAMAAVAPRYFWTTYLPGIALGLCLCLLHGHFEHARGTTSHYGRLYNVLFFNDGYHVEHHERPGVHWSRLGQRPKLDASASAWPPVLRWMEALAVWRHPLDGLETVVLRWPRLQRAILKSHRLALETALRGARDISRVAIIGGGLFPRTALILRDLLPAAALTVIDADERHLARARPLLGDDVHTERHRFNGDVTPGDPDMVVIPLAYRGNREAIYRHPPARIVLVHDWLWRPRGRSVRISLLLLKRLNVVTAVTD
jgi:hypothetical protein